MHEETLVTFAFEPIHALRIIACPERRCDKSLRFPACEDGRAVSARQDAGFDPDRTYRFKRASIRPLTLLQDFIAEDAFLEGVEGVFDHHGLRGVDIREQSDRLLLCSVDEF